MKRLKRLAAAATLVVALAVPASAMAATDYSGSIAGGGTVKFTKDRRNGHKVVVRFKWADLPVNCNSGPVTSSGKIVFAMRLRQGQFEDSAFAPQGGKVHVAGEISGTSAAGTIKVTGDIPEGNNCTSGKKEWTAGAV